MVIEEQKPRRLSPNASNQSKKRCTWFTESRFGLFIHWGISAIPARGEWVRGIEKIDDKTYHQYHGEFNPIAYEPKKWAAVAKAAGQKYAVMTAKHHDGYCLFDSKLTDFKLTNEPGKRDYIREYVDAFRAEGLKIGLYYSLIDWNHPGYPIDRLHPLRENEIAKQQTRNFDEYLEYFHGQVMELMKNYGKIDIMWFDFSYDSMSGEVWKATELVKAIRSINPDILIDNRLSSGHEDPFHQETGFGDFTSPEQIIPPDGVTDSKGNPLAWEACITLNDHWGYVRDDQNYKSAAQAVRMLVECVSKGGNLLLNVGPDAKGRIPKESVVRLQQVGEWMERNSASIYGCGHAEFPKPEWGRYTQRGNFLYAHLFEKPVGAIALLGLGKKIKRARMLADGSEVDLQRPWNAGKSEDDVFFNLPGPNLPDPIDTVIELELL